MHSKIQRPPIVPVVSYATLVEDGPRAFPIREAFKRIGVKSLKGYELINSGQLQTFCIGRRRYATAEAITAFIERCIAASKESDAQRGQKVAKATKASLLSRGNRRGG